jgi:hypothetical protein
MSGRLTRGENLASVELRGLRFVTATPASDSQALRIAHDLVSRPKHAWVTQLARVDGAAISDAWSMSWRIATSGDLEVTFQGLADATEYLFSMVVE